MKEIVLTDRGPKPIGPYSQGVRANGFLFISGQVSFDPATSEMTGTDAAQQTQRVMDNIKAILEAAASNFHHVVKTTVFIKDMGEFAKMNEIYARYFPENPPSRSTIEAARLPRDVRIEIECIALV